MKTPKDYKKEKDSFYLLESILKNKTSLCFTDGESYVIGKYQEYPTWIWSKDQIGDKEVEEIRRINVIKSIKM